MVGTVFSGTRMDGVLTTKVRRDGINATRALQGLIEGSRFFEQLQVVLLQGIAFAGFNVVDIRKLRTDLGIPVLTVVRKQPDLNAIRTALLSRVPGGQRKWRLIEQAGAMEMAGGLYVQRQGISLADADRLIRRLALNSALPEPLRAAHMIAAGVGQGESRHRP